MVNYTNFKSIVVDLYDKSIEKNWMRESFKAYFHPVLNLFYKVSF